MITIVKYLLCQQQDNYVWEITLIGTAHYKHVSKGFYELRAIESMINHRKEEIYYAACNKFKEKNTSTRDIISNGKRVYFQHLCGCVQSA